MPKASMHYRPIPKIPPISGIGIDNGELCGGGAVALSISGAVRFADGAFALLRGFSGGASALLRGLASCSGGASELLRGLASCSGGASELLRGLASCSGGAFATHISFSACWPRGQSKGQMRLVMPRTASIVPVETSSDMVIEASFMNRCQAVFVSSSNWPFTVPLKQPTRWSSNCSDRVSSCGSGDGVTVGFWGIASRDAILCSATERSELSGNCRTNCRS